MKNIAIVAPYHFKDVKLFNEALDSIILFEDEERLTYSAFGILSDLVRDYASTNFLDHHCYISNWAKHKEADNERDKLMISEANELIVFDDGVTNRINLMKQWAIEENIPIHLIEIASTDSIKYAEIISKNLNHLEDPNELAIAVEEFEIAKEQAIKEGEFEMAAIIRHKIKMLNAK